MTDKRVALIEKLIASSAAAKISWDQGSAGFTYNSGESSVSITERSGDYRLFVRDQHGRVVESFDDNELSSEGVGNAFDLMKSLFNFARRSALGTDAVIDDLLSKL